VSVGHAYGAEGGGGGAVESRLTVDLDQACLRARSGGAWFSAYSL
jgi:hypothetical protein